jgi:hypothetical protein
MAGPAAFSPALEYTSRLAEVVTDRAPAYPRELDALVPPSAYRRKGPAPSRLRPNSPALSGLGNQPKLSLLTSWSTHRPQTDPALTCTFRMAFPPARRTLHRRRCNGSSRSLAIAVRYSTWVERDDRYSGLRSSGTRARSHRGCRESKRPDLYRRLIPHMTPTPCAGGRGHVAAPQLTMVSIDSWCFSNLT